MIEAMSVGATPGIHLQILQHVHSEALAELLATVYEQVATVTGAAQTLPPPAFVPVVKPNAVLVIAAGDDLPSILELIDELDRPVDPRTQFAVFRLKNAIASQVVTMLESFYEDRSGLGARVRAVADMRTNAVVVQAEPNDLREVTLLIQKIDQEASEAVNDIKIFPLKNALAEELANLINQAIQSVLSPATTAGTAGQPQIAAAARVAQELQEAKSAILQFLAVEGEKQKLVRSGILADIRITPDPRTNSLVVTAPPESMDLIEALIKYLDRPAEQVAEIKIFTLQNASAQTVAEILDALFEDTLSGDGETGIRLAGSEDATSALVGLRFSVDTRTNSLIAIGGADALSVVEAIVLRLDQGDLRQRRSEVIRLKNSAAEDA
ncbi:MAG TPA: hypothetical protein EYP14_10295 [Planctomycetaceae bacterium]|nr:hypothetical protein [Planctomycetaceae bacterium]